PPGPCRTWEPLSPLRPDLSYTRPRTNTNPQATAEIAAAGDLAGGRPRGMPRALYGGIAVQGPVDVRRTAQPPRTRPDGGAPVPAVTSTLEAPSTWFTEVPRICRTPSAIPFMPWM